MLRTLDVLRGLLLCYLGLFALCAQASLPSDELQLQTMQVYTCRSINSLLLLRGEGFQENHAAQLEKDLATLDSTLKSYARSDTDLKKAHAEFVTQIRNGVSYGPKEEDLPWRYNQDLSRALRDLLNQIERFVPASANAGQVPLWELPVRVEFLATQYLGRAYMSGLEISREQPQEYLGQDESVLVPLLSQRIEQLPDGDTTKKLQTRWDYLSKALLDMNSKSNALVSASGRPWAPIIVERNARAVSGQLMQISQQ
ncbi:hypothetical protein NK553_23295 [Pseudomonas sp. ZM23]|uniref:Uncharacterized protein n=1 Tax=Pseudomonas triclosanedens TaxID=2961893 RepID=A0ABY6ZXY1_9PSED|nr:hypothetical protein [Pseudomonas triclosanedens]MCP8466884.1 hypothetical protein [Pseudomonas triclosanedens]MCP8470108.1 hypothetical protein [Pseudomonas triclosanedens]MCP8478018.1 hypothetical protein [Pseudomonas triclosanedens]WAI49432.1 hypothetical protein OU419_27470 [Pseudomonas triclosanedens]